MNDDTYSDIIDLPHYEPQYHRRMPTTARAAQFAPFAALKGDGETVGGSGIKQNDNTDDADF